MTKSSIAASCGKIVDECKTAGFKSAPCSKIKDDNCTVYPLPERWWKKGGCPMRSLAVEVEQTWKMNPLKASKKAKKGGGIL